MSASMRMHVCYLLLSPPCKRLHANARVLLIIITTLQAPPCECTCATRCYHHLASASMRMHVCYSLLSPPCKRLHMNTRVLTSHGISNDHGHCHDHGIFILNKCHDHGIFILNLKLTILLTRLHHFVHHPVNYALSCILYFFNCAVLFPSIHSSV
jgi:hypothetical protein